MKWYQSLNLSIASIFLLWSHFGFSQKIVPIEGKRYIYNDVIYKYPEMEPVFNKYQMAHIEFLEAEKKRKTARGYGYAALISIPAGFGIGALVYESTKNDPWNFGAYFTAMGIWSLGLISGIVAIAKNGTANKHKKKSIQYFNDMQQQPPINNNLRPTVELVVRNGIGVVYKF